MAGGLLAVVGMAAEARIIRRSGGRAVIAGAVRLDDIAADGATGIVSFGLCGALSPEFAVGDLVIAQAVVTPTQRWIVDAAWRERLQAALPTARPAVIASADAIAADTAAKAALRAASGADAVDLEFHRAAALAQRLALPFAAVRAVSDAAGRDLPSAALAGFRADGRTDVAAVLAALLADPRQLPALLRTAREAGAALAALRRAASSLARREREGPTRSVGG